MKAVILAATIIICLISACDNKENKQSISVQVGSATSSVPFLVQVESNYNIVKFNGKFYACPHGQEINWENDDVTKIPGVFMADSLDGAIAMIKR